MRVVYCGNFGPEWSTENDIRKAFEFLGWEVVKAQENEVGWQFIREQALSSDLLLWTSTWDTAQPLYESIETIRLLGMKGIPSATVHLDVFHNSDRGDRKWHMNPMFFTSHVFTASGDFNKEWKLMGVNHIWLPPAVRHNAVHTGNFRQEYACDVAFVGSNGVNYHTTAWPYRKELVDYIRDMCKRNGWTFKNPGGDDHKIDRNDDMNDFYASAKVTIGDSLCLRKEKSEYWSDRVPEATGRGGFLIMPRINAIEKIYGDTVPTYDWNNFQDLEVQIKRWIPDDFGRTKRQEQAQKITATEHTYVNRVKTIIEKVGLNDINRK